MNISLQLECPDCGKPETQRIHLDTSSLDFRCAHCGHRHVGIFGLDMTIGVLILERSRYELKIDKDYSMSIILAAAAVESELYRLFCKWAHIKRIETDLSVIQEECEKELRPMNIVAKIEWVSH